MRTTLWMALAVGLLATACDEQKPAPTTQPSATTAAVTASATAAAAPSGSAGGAKAGHMAHCPNAVDGADTAFKDVDGGVEVTVTAKAAAATTEIRERAKHLVEAAKNDAGKVKHSGTGEGGGMLGRCPIVMRGTKVAAADVDGGSKISVTVEDAKEVDWLRRESRERQEEMKEGGADAGKGKMAHCPSAVEGATTAVKKTKDAVEVTVTSKDEKATTEIRDRAKKLVEAAKASGKGKHDGAGSGGGGVGRCPVVLKDTTVEAKDVPGGSTLTVKPDKAGDLDAVAKEAQERVQKFGAAAAGSAAPAAGSAAPAAGSAAPPKK